MYGTCTYVRVEKVCQQMYIDVPIALEFCYKREEFKTIIFVQLSASAIVCGWFAFEIRGLMLKNLRNVGTYYKISYIPWSGRP